MSSDAGQMAAEDHKGEGGARAILRVTEVLSAIASKRGGGSLAELGQMLELPKTSLHRLLRTLQQAGFFVEQSGVYNLGPESFRLAEQIRAAAPATLFPACARFEMERLAAASGETILLGEATEAGDEVVYVDVIESEAALRYAMRIGNRRPLFAVASGKILLAYARDEERQRYLRTARFDAFTSETTDPDHLPDILVDARAAAAVVDRNGFVDGASSIAGPVFDSDGAILAAIAMAGPTDRLLANREKHEGLVKAAGERISRVLGYSGDYPPAN